MWFVALCVQLCGVQFVVFSYETHRTWNVTGSFKTWRFRPYEEQTPNLGACKSAGTCHSAIILCSHRAQAAPHLCRSTLLRGCPVSSMTTQPETHRAQSLEKKRLLHSMWSFVPLQNPASLSPVPDLNPHPPSGPGDISDNIHILSNTLNKPVENKKPTTIY